MSDLTERMRRLADQSAEYWADIIGSIVAGSTAPGGSTLAARLERLLREAADEIDRLHTAEFIGRLPDYVKELEADLEWARQQWVNGEDPMCEDVCEIACKGPCQGITDALGRKQQP